MTGEWAGIAAHVGPPRGGRIGRARGRLRQLPQVVSENERVILSISRRSGQGGLFGGCFGQITVAADARIDNEQQLRSDVSAGQGAPLAEVLARAYALWGTEFARALRGDFAILLWDAAHDRLVACRDPFATRPLFFRREGTEAFFASAIEPILESFDSRPPVDDQSVVEHLLWRFRSTDRTFFSSVSAVPAGHVLTLHDGRIETRRYWLPPTFELAARRMSAQDWYAELSQAFIRSVTNRLKGASAAVIHVSGGLDSSSIAGAADRLRRAGDPRAARLVGAAGLHPGLSCDETPYIEAVRRHVSFPVEVWNAAQPDGSAFDDPAVDRPGNRAAMIGGSGGDLAIAREAGATIILCGMGGDELMSTAGNVQDALSAGDVGYAIREILFFDGADWRQRLARMKYLLREATPIPIRRPMARWRARLPDWLHPRFRAMARDLFEPERPAFEFESHIAEKKWARVSSAALLGPIAAIQRSGRAAGIEYRFPFLDRDLLAIAMRIPYWEWPAPSLFARIHRQAFKELLPDEVRRRDRKTEFTPALANVLRSAAASVDKLLQGDWHSAAYVDQPAVRRIWSDLTRRGDAASAEWRGMWAVLTLEAWLRRISGYHPPREDLY